MQRGTGNNNSYPREHLRFKEYQSDTPMGDKRQGQRIFKGEIRNRKHPLLLLASLSTQTGIAAIPEPVLHQMGGGNDARENAWAYHFCGR